MNRAKEERKGNLSKIKLSFRTSVHAREDAFAVSIVWCFFLNCAALDDGDSSEKTVLGCQGLGPVLWQDQRRAQRLVQKWSRTQPLSVRIFYCWRTGKQQLKLESLNPQRWVPPRQSRVLGKEARRILLDYSHKQLESALSGGWDEASSITKLLG